MAYNNPYANYSSLGSQMYDTTPQQRWRQGMYSDRNQAANMTSTGVRRDGRDPNQNTAYLGGPTLAQRQQAQQGAQYGQQAGYQGQGSLYHMLSQGGYGGQMNPAQPSPTQPPATDGYGNPYASLNRQMVGG